MKLFKPVLNWFDDTAVSGNRRVVLTVLGNDAVSLTLTKSAAESSIDSVVVPPLPTEPGVKAAPEMEFLFGVHAALQLPMQVFLMHDDQHMRNVALAGMARVMREMVRSIESMPHSTERSLELTLRSFLAGIPPSYGMMLFYAEIEKDLVEEQSQFELGMKAKFHGVDPLDLATLLLNEMPPPSYEPFLPPLTQEMLDALEHERAKRARPQ